MHDDTIAIMHVKKWNSAAAELTLENKKYFKNGKIENKKIQAIMKKTCPIALPLITQKLLNKPIHALYLSRDTLMAKQRT